MFRSLKDNLQGVCNSNDLLLLLLPLPLLLLLILQSFDWLATFHLELLQAILFIVL